MSKEEIIEALKNIKIRCHSKVVWDDPIDSDLDIVEKSLKALEIIKEKLVDVSLIKKYDFVEDYNSSVWIAGRPKLVKEEYETIKEVLE